MSIDLYIPWQYILEKPVVLFFRIDEHSIYIIGMLAYTLTVKKIQRRVPAGDRYYNAAEIKFGD